VRSELDRRFDEKLAEVIAPGGRLVIGHDDQGRAIVENFPATIPSLFRTFCSLNADSEAVVCGAERLTYAEGSIAATASGSRCATARRGS
jgi:long-chain acyl-CoA synthetase